MVTGRTVRRAAAKAAHDSPLKYSADQLPAVKVVTGSSDEDVDDGDGDRDGEGDGDGDGDGDGWGDSKTGKVSL
jgi:hypothetical protein